MRLLRVVVNADDLGMSPAVDDAILHALGRRLVTSTTVLANGPSAAEALRRVGALRGVSVGVHLNLTEFVPLTGGLARFVGSDGALGPLSLRVGPGDRDAVLAEWTAQVERVRAAGIAVSHLDSHQHLHHLPVLRPVLAALRARFGIARVRGMGALRGPGAGGTGTRRVRALLGALRQRARAERFVRGLRREGAVTTDGFASVSVFLAHAHALPAGWRTVELMAHPGNPHNAAYAEELARLEAGALRELPVRLVSWWDIA